MLEGREDCQRHPAAGTGLGCGTWTISGPACSWPSPPLQPIAATALLPILTALLPPKYPWVPSNNFCGALVGPGDSLGQFGA